MSNCETGYPGALSTPAEVLQLATEYRAAAHRLADDRSGKTPLRLAPFRDAAIHAIELYMNAFLLHRGSPASHLRAMHHDLRLRAQRCVAEGLKLRERTLLHLYDMTDRRERLIVRYDAVLAARRQTPINRVVATLDEIARKVETLIAQPVRSPAAASADPEALIQLKTVPNRRSASV